MVFNIYIYTNIKNTTTILKRTICFHPVFYFRVLFPCSVLPILQQQVLRSLLISVKSEARTVNHENDV